LAEGQYVKFELPVENDHDTRRIKDNVATSRKFENQRAKELGGHAQPGSGSSTIPGYREDIRKIGKFLAQHKFTRNTKQYALKVADWVQLVRTAMAIGDEMPAMIIDFKNLGETIVVIPYIIFEEMAYADDH